MIVYPGSPPGSELDVFTVPTEPEGTPLSSPGTSTRNHTELHDDQGAAIEALQDWASIRTHDHSGASPLRAHGNKLVQANTHESADTDTNGGIHQTLGIGQYQAAAGNHVHDYTSDRITNKPFEICVSTDRPEAFDGKFIWEVDTRRLRVWSQFPGQDTLLGLYSIDDFERLSSNDLGSTLWEQTYDLSPSTNGKMAITDGHDAAWVRQGNAANRCIARRIKTEDKYTETFDQVITFTTTAAVSDGVNAEANNPTSNDMYFRMSDDREEYVFVQLAWSTATSGVIKLYYTTGGSDAEVFLGQLPGITNAPNVTWSGRLVGNKFELYRGIESIGSILDEEGVTVLENKGWGIGMHAGDGGSVQDLPNEVTKVGIADAVHYRTSPVWQLLPIGDTPRVALAVTGEQSIHQSGSMIEWDYVQEDNFGFWNTAEKENLVITEPGVYHVHASIVWGTDLIGDHAGTILMINNTPTPNMHWEFVRGNEHTPGFSQTVDVTGYVRLDLGDRLGVAAAHNGSDIQWTGYKKNYVVASNVVTQLSRLFVTFHSA